MLQSRLLRVAAAALLAVVAIARPASAPAQSFNDELVQPPALRAPARGSIAGSLAGFEPGVADLVRGSFALPAPLEFPSERGRLLATIAPSYSPDAGLSEWGMGWRAPLAITRHRLVGDIDYATDDFVSPWGRLVAATDGFHYPQGFAAVIRLELTAAGTWLAVDGSGRRYEFDRTVAGAGGTYAWYLTRVSTAQGDETALDYSANASGRLFLDEVVYGVRGHTGSYRVVISYAPLAVSFDDYRSGLPLSLDRRVSGVAVEVQGATGYAPRWHYELRHQTSPLSPAFYLHEVQRTFASGSSEPPVAYDHDFGDRTLQAASFERVAALDDYIQQTGAAGIQPTHVSQLDLERDGLLDLEHYYAQATVRQRETGWTIEATPPAANPHAACRPAPSTTNRPRHLARLRAADDEAGVFRATYSAGPNQTTILFCDRPGALRATQQVAGDWAPGPNTRLVDIDRDRQPDLVRHRAGTVDVMANISDESGYAFAPPTSQALTPSYTPDGSWLHDMNGDGMADLISRYAGGLTVWFGTGQHQFVGAGLDLHLRDRNGARVQSLGRLRWIPRSIERKMIK